MQNFLQCYSCKLAPEFCHKFQVDLSILQSRFDFLENYLNERYLASCEGSLLNDHENVSSKCISCLQQAENLLRQEIDTTAFSLVEKHQFDLQV